MHVSVSASWTSLTLYTVTFPHSISFFSSRSLFPARFFPAVCFSSTFRFFNCLCRFSVEKNKQGDFWFFYGIHYMVSLSTQLINENSTTAALTCKVHMKSFSFFFQVTTVWLVKSAWEFRGKPQRKWRKKRPLFGCDRNFNTTSQPTRFLLM